jgi:hypothetical protein
MIREKSWGISCSRGEQALWMVKRSYHYIIYTVNSYRANIQGMLTSFLACEYNRHPDMNSIYREY